MTVISIVKNQETEEFEHELSSSPANNAVLYFHLVATHFQDSTLATFLHKFSSERKDNKSLQEAVDAVQTLMNKIIGIYAESNQRFMVSCAGLATKETKDKILLYQQKTQTN